MRKNSIVCLTFLLIAFSLGSKAQIVPNIKLQAYNLITHGDYIGAIKLINKGLQYEPGSAELYLFRGYARYGLDDLIGAENDYTVSLNLSPYNPDVFNYRGLVRSQLQKYDGAFQDFEAALALDNKRADIYLSRARTYLVLKKYFNCIVDCNEAENLKLKGEGVYLVRGSAKLALKRYDEAIIDLNKAVAADPSSPYTYTQRAMIWMEQEKADSAIADFNRALAVDSLNTYALFNRALAYSKKKDYEKSLSDLDKVISLSPYNSYAYYNRAITWIELDNKKKAIGDFAAVSRLDPRNIISYYYSSRLKYDLKMYSEALADLDKTLELYPDYTDAWYDRHLVKLKLNDKKGAMEDLRHVEESGKRNQLTPDSVRKNKESYLKSLITLSGDFEEMNTLNSKFQNQQVDIELMPMFRPVTCRTDMPGRRIYDAFRKPNYYTNFIFLSDSLPSTSDTILNNRLDSLRNINTPGAVQYYMLASAFSEAGIYDSAIWYYSLSIRMDSNFLTSYLGRSYAHFHLIEYYQKEIEEEEPVLIMASPAEKKKPVPVEPVHTLDEVYNDLSKVITLDPSFPYGYYNRAFISARMGRYSDAVSDFSIAIKLDPSLQGAWYGRGLVNILLKNEKYGCEDLSKAGELGITNAFRVMKRYCFRN